MPLVLKIQDPLYTILSVQRVLGGARNVPLPLLSVLVSFVAQNALAIFQVRNEVYVHY